MRKAITLTDLAKQFKTVDKTDFAAFKAVSGLVEVIDKKLFRDGVIEIRGDFCVMCDLERYVG